MKKTLVTSLFALITAGAVSGANAAGIPPVSPTPSPTNTMSYYQLGNPNDDKGGMGLPVAEERFRNAIGWTNELKTDNKAIVPAINELVDTISTFTPPTGGVATEINSDNEIDLLYKSDHLSITIGNELDVKVNGTITSDTTIGGGGSIVTGKTVYDYITNYTQAPLTASDGIFISSDDEISAVGDGTRGVLVTSDGIGVKVDGTSVTFTSDGELKAIAASTPLTAGDAIDAAKLASDEVAVLYDGTTIGLNSDGELEARLSGLLIESDGIHITSDNEIMAVGDANRAVTVTSDGIGVVAKSDGAISVASDGIGVKVDNTTVVINSDGELESKGGIPEPGSDCYIGGINYCVLSYDVGAGEFVWNKMI